MVTNCQVFGARAGRYAAEHARDRRSLELPKGALALAVARLRGYGRGRRRAEEVFAALQEVAARNLMVVRNQGGLGDVLSRIQGLRESWLPGIAADDASSLRRAIEAENSLLTAELMAHAALTRQESRGSHFREDYPRQDDDDWRVNVIFCQVEGRLEHRTAALSQDKPREVPPPV